RAPLLPTTSATVAPIPLLAPVMTMTRSFMRASLTGARPRREMRNTLPPMADWKAETYHRVSEPQTKWGEAVLAALELRGDETVMDAGCGTGRLTAKLVERLPRGRVVALDASPAML